MKKIGKSLLAVALLAALLTGCDSTKSEEKSTSTTKDASEKEWSYEGETGPDNWEELGFIEAGKEQSPINIVTSTTKEENTATEEIINYGLTSFKEFNNGHTIEAIPQSTNDTVVIDGNTYTLAQFHFHAPSEHQIDGKNSDMELHLVNKDAQGNIAVLGILIKEGAENQELAKIWSKLPTEVTEEEEAAAIEQQIDVMKLLPTDQTKYEYKGSLTTPPCTENVKWYVFAQPIEMSKEQIDKFKSLYEDDHRPVQPLNDRDVYKD